MYIHAYLHVFIYSPLLFVYIYLCHHIREAQISSLVPSQVPNTNEIKLLAPYLPCDS